MTTLTLDLSPITTLTREQFRKLCRANPEMRLERSPQRALIIMSPTGGETGNFNSQINGELYLWNKTHQIGKTFDSSTGFELPEGGAIAPPMPPGFLANNGMPSPPQPERGFCPSAPNLSWNCSPPPTLGQKAKPKWRNI